jgi:hypothetical protein
MRSKIFGGLTENHRDDRLGHEQPGRVRLLDSSGAASAIRGEPRSAESSATLSRIPPALRRATAFLKTIAPLRPRAAAHYEHALYGRGPNRQC